MNRKVIIASICLSLIVLFLYAALTKLVDYHEFRFGLSESPFIHPFSGVLAWAIPVAEIAIAVMLVWPRTRLAALYASFILMTAFTLYIAAMLASASEIPCSCGGVLEKMTWPQHIVFNAAFVILSAIGIFLERKKLNYKKSAVNLRNLSYAKRHISQTDAH